MDPQPHWHRLQVLQNTTQLLPLQWTQIHQIMITSWEFSFLLIHFQLIWKFFKSIIPKPRVLSLNKIWNIQRMINKTMLKHLNVSFMFTWLCFAEKKKKPIPWRKYRTKTRVEMLLDVTWIHHWKKKGKKRTLTKPLRVRAVQGLSGLALLNVEPVVVKILF